MITVFRSTTLYSDLTFTTPHYEILVRSYNTETRSFNNITALSFDYSEIIWC